VELENELKALMQKISELENKQSAIKSGITALVSPLERVLRKYEKITAGTGKIKIIGDFLKDQIGTLRESGDALKEFEGVCGELEKALLEDKLKEDAKDKGKHLELLEKIGKGKLGEMLGELQSVEDEKNNKNGEINALGDAIRKIEGEEKNIRLNEEEIKKFRVLLLENQAGIEKTILLLEEGLGKWSDCEIKIIRN
jgi:chromosome segregation ATPase